MQNRHLRSESLRSLNKNMFNNLSELVEEDTEAKKSAAFFNNNKNILLSLFRNSEKSLGKSLSGKGSEISSFGKGLKKAEKTKKEKQKIKKENSKESVDESELKESNTAGKNNSNKEWYESFCWYCKLHLFDEIVEKQIYKEKLYEDVYDLICDEPSYFDTSSLLSTPYEFARFVLSQMEDSRSVKTKTAGLTEDEEEDIEENLKKTTQECIHQKQIKEKSETQKKRKIEEGGSELSEDTISDYSNYFTEKESKEKTEDKKDFCVSWRSTVTHGRKRVFSCTDYTRYMNIQKRNSPEIKDQINNERKKEEESYFSIWKRGNLKRSYSLEYKKSYYEHSTVPTNESFGTFHEESKQEKKVEEKALVIENVNELEIDDVKNNDEHKEKCTDNSEVLINRTIKDYKVYEPYKEHLEYVKKYYYTNETKKKPFPLSLYANVKCYSYIKQCSRCYCFFNEQSCHCIECKATHNIKYKNPHYFIFQHGLTAGVHDFQNIINPLLEKNPQLFIYVTYSNQAHSFEGVKVGTERISAEILCLLKIINPNINISMIGHSFGGILLRSVLVKLYNRSLFKNKKLVNFITFACPHIGVHENIAILKTLSTYLGAHTIDDLNNKTTALLKIANLKCITILKKFENIIFYGNTQSDWLVGIRTSLILPYSLFNEDLIMFILEQARNVPEIPLSIFSIVHMYMRKKKLLFFYFYQDLNNSKYFLGRRTEQNKFLDKMLETISFSRNLFSISPQKKNEVSDMLHEQNENESKEKLLEEDRAYSEPNNYTTTFVYENKNVLLSNVNKEEEQSNIIFKTKEKETPLRVLQNSEIMYIVNKQENKIYKKGDNENSDGCLSITKEDSLLKDEINNILKYKTYDEIMYKQKENMSSSFCESSTNHKNTEIMNDNTFFNEKELKEEMKKEQQNVKNTDHKIEIHELKGEENAQLSYSLSDLNINQNEGEVESQEQIKKKEKYKDFEKLFFDCLISKIINEKKAMDNNMKRKKKGTTDSGKNFFLQNTIKIIKNYKFLSSKRNSKNNVEEKIYDEINNSLTSEEKDKFIIEENGKCMNTNSTESIKNDDENADSTSDECDYINEYFHSALTYNDKISVMSNDNSKKGENVQASQEDTVSLIKMEQTKEELFCEKCKTMKKINSKSKKKIDNILKDITISDIKKYKKMLSQVYRISNDQLIDKFFKNPELLYYEILFLCLNQLPIQRYSVYMPLYSNAHVQIIAHPRICSEEVVIVKHFVEHLIL